TPLRSRTLPARDGLHAADDRHRALRRRSLEDLDDRRDRAAARYPDQADGAGRGRRTRAAAGGRAAADPRSIAAALLRAHLFRAERRARPARDLVATRTSPR